MTTEWVITAAAERVKLGGGNRGETSFTVTNQGSAPDRVVFEVVAGDGADGSWFVPPEEPQLLVAGGASVSYLVKIVVPAGAPAAEYWLQGRGYSADTAPEEGSRLSGRVAFAVAETAKPAKPWWPYAVAAGLVLVVLAVGGWLVFRGDGEPVAEPSPTPTPAATPIRGGTLTLPALSSVIFDEGTVVQGKNGDMFSSTLPFGPPGFLEFLGNARGGYRGVVVNPGPSTCANLLLGADAIPIQNLERGGVLCVVTNRGRTAVVTVLEVDLRGGRGELVLRFALFGPQRG